MRKSQIKDQVQKMGLWKEYVALREHIRGEVSDEHLAEIAFQRLMEGERAAFRRASPPNSDPEPSDHPQSKPAEPESSVRKEDFEGKPPSSKKEDLDWVYQNLDVADVTIEDCPSAGAWSLRAWAASSFNRTEFYRMWAQSLRWEAKEDGKEIMQDDGGTLNLISRVLRARESAILPDGSEDVSGESEVSAESD